MGRSRQMAGDRRNGRPPLSRSERRLIAVQGLLTLASAIAAIFLNLYLFEQGGFRTVLLYRLVSMVLLYAVYIASGYVLRRRSARDLVQGGLALQAGLYLAVFFAGSHALPWLVPLGVLNGIGQGLFWAGINIIIYVDTHTATRTLFFSRLQPIVTAAAALGPIAGGAVIAVAILAGHGQLGYSIIFAGLSLVLLSGALVGRRLAPYTGIRFSISDVFGHRHSAASVSVLAQQVVNGLWDTAFGTVWVLVLFIAVGSDTLVSVVAAAGAAVYAASSLVAGRTLTRKPLLSIIGTVLRPVGLVLFAVGPGWLKVISLVFLLQAAAPFQTIPVLRVIFDTMDDLPGEWRQKYHYLVEREILLGAGRVVSFIVLTAAFGRGDDSATVQVVVVALAACPLMVGLLQHRIDHLRAQVPVTLPSAPRAAPG